MSIKINFKSSSINSNVLIDLYHKMLKSRMIEEKMLILLRQGKISKWFSGIGQEAVSAGAVAALNEDEFILPMHRNLGIFTGRGIPLNKLFFHNFKKKKMALPMVEIGLFILVL